MMHSRHVLSDDTLRATVPAIFAAQPFQGMSDKYRFIPTSDIVTALRAENWQPVWASNARTRVPGKAGFQKHMVRFAQPQAMQPMVGDSHPEVVLVNSHDGSSGFQFYAGLFRLVCANGMIVCDRDHGNVSARHMGRTNKEVILEAAYEVIQDLPALPERVTRMQAVTLTSEEQHAFADAALLTRWERPEDTSVRAPQLLIAHQWADAAAGRVAKPDLWTTFNVIQQNLLQGGVRTRTSAGKRRTTAAVASVTEDVRLNKALWTLAESMVRLKAA